MHILSSIPGSLGEPHDAPLNLQLAILFLSIYFAARASPNGKEERCHEQTGAADENRRLVI